MRIDIATVQGTPAMQPEELGKDMLDVNEESGKTLREFSEVFHSVEKAKDKML